MRTQAALAIAAAASAAIAANPTGVTITGTLDAGDNGNGDFRNAGLAGATFALDIVFEADATYADWFGLPAAHLPDNAAFAVFGAPDPDLNDRYTLGPAVALPTFAMLTTPTGLFAPVHAEADSGTTLSILGLFLPPDDADNVAAGTPIRPEHFHNAVNAGFYVQHNGFEYTAESLTVRSSELVPAPGATALAAVGALAVTRRRRR